MASLTWQEYKHLEWSFTADPPVEDRLDTLLNLLYYRVSFLFGAKDAPSFEEFRIKWDTVSETPDDPEPVDEDAAAVAEALAAKAAMRMGLGVTANMGMQDLFTMMTGGDPAPPAPEE